MSHPLTIYPQTALRVVPAYGITVAQFAVMAQFGSIAFDLGVRYDKRRKQLHRMTVGGANGTQQLTVPLVKPEHLTGTTVADLQMSSHGQWWNIHWGAIESAYGRSSYFEYYAPDLQPIYTAPSGDLMQFNIALHRFCCQVLGLPHLCGGIAATVNAESPLLSDLPLPTELPYYQVWTQRFGFTPGLSILDLIFNLGPESPLYLRTLRQSPEL